VDGEFFAIAVPPTDVSEECRLIAHFFLAAHFASLFARMRVSTKLLIVSG